jgi:hypothetical protein
MSDPLAPEVAARTLAYGRLLGTAQIAWAASPFRVRHATDPDGNPILLCRTGSALSHALRPQHGDDVAAVLCVEDFSPGAAYLGRVWISGWAHPIGAENRQRAALEFADVNPVSDLLDVGRGFELHHLDVAEVRLERGGELLEIDVELYSAARPAALQARQSSGPVA